LDGQPVETTLYSLNDSAPEPAQRRTSERHLSLLRVGALIVGERRELCLIRNVSAGGMMIRAYSAIPEKTPVAIELKHGDPVRGSVKWINGDTIGIAFDQPIDVISLISASEDGPRPRMPRIEVQCTAWIREDGTMHRAQALNISQGGAKVTSRTALTVGSDVVVTLPGLSPIAGVVRWEQDGAYGLTFNRGLTLSSLVSWLQEQQDEQKVRSGGKARAAG